MSDNRARQSRIQQKLDEAAGELRKSNPRLTKAQAITQVIEDDPSWATDYDTATRRDAQSAEDELLAGNRDGM